jgi:hypothetical protein
MTSFDDSVRLSKYKACHKVTEKREEACEKNYQEAFPEKAL